MTQIKPTTEFVFERTEHGEKFHIRPRFSPDFRCHAPHTFSRYEEGPINLNDLCLNCYACNEGYEIVAKKEVEMSNTEPKVPEGYRIMEVGEAVTEECRVWAYGRGPWAGDLCESEVGEDCYPICCPIEMSDKRDSYQKCGVPEDKVKLASSEHYHLVCHPCLEELYQREFSQSSCTGECDHLQFEYEQANEMLCKAQTRIEELEGCNSRQAEQLKLTHDRLKGLEKKNLDLIEDRQGLYEDLEDLNAANDELNADDAKQVDRVCRLERANHRQQDNLDKLEKREADAYAMFEIENKARVEAVRKVAELDKENQRLKNSDKEILATISNLDKKHAERVAELEKERDELEDDVERIVGYNQDQLSKMGELEKERDEAKDILGRSCKEYLAAYEKEHATVADLDKERNELKADLELTSVTLKGMCEERNSYLSECRDYHTATNGHGLEDIKTIMEAGPSPEELEGYELEYRRPSIEESWHAQDTWHENTVCHGRVFVRTPIIEYLTNEEITDELCKELGRIECEVAWQSDFSDGVEATLIGVYTDRYVILEGGRQIDGVVRSWAFRNCRIKKSTVEHLKND